MSLRQTTRHKAGRVYGLRMSEDQRILGGIVIGITRNRLRNLSIWGCFGLALLAVGGTALPMPAWADYQTGVDAYYRGDFQAARDAWLPLAQAGDPVAQNSLGALYDHGLGVQEDNWEAARWYEMAAQQGLPLAMRNLANQYATGHGIPYDLDLARQWYQRAADLGDQQSVSLLRQLRPSAAATTSAATPEFAAPAATGTLAAPVESPSASQSTVASQGSSDDLMVTGMESVDSSAPAMPAGGIALDIGGQTVTMPTTGEPAAPAVPQQPAQQQAAIIAPPARSDGNWLVGQWQGPSLGCPKDGGIEFTDGETLSWFDGSVAVRMAATYRIEGDNIAVVSTASDGSTQEYAYRRSGADQMVIVSVPEAMPKSMIGITYRRCGATGAMAAAQPGIIEVPTTSTQAAQPSTTAAAAAAPPPDPAATAAALANVQVPAGVTAADGWRAFENGNPVEALAIFRTLGEAGDSNMQVIVGQIYDFGQGVPQDDPQALEWYLRAANAGNPKGQYQAGALYYRSQGVPQNLIESYRWLTVAAEGKPQGLEVNPAQSVAIQAKSMLNDVARLMSDGDISKAKKLAAETLKKN